MHQPQAAECALAERSRPISGRRSRRDFPIQVVIATRFAAAATLTAVMCAFISYQTGCNLSPEAFADSKPFMLYEAVVKEPGLDLMTVTGTVYGSMAESVALARPDPERRNGLDPIGLRAADSSGNPLEVRAEGDGWVIESKGRDFTWTYDVVLTIVDRYSAEIRGMLSLLGPSRSRIMGRDLFLVPSCDLEDGVIVDLDAGDGGPAWSAWSSTGGRMMVPDAESLASTLMISGDYRVVSLELQGSRIRLAIGGRWSFGDEEFLEVVRAIAEKELDWFGSSPCEGHLIVCDENPVRGSAGFDHYGVHFGGNVLLLLDRRLDRSGLYGTPMSIVAHEFFHNWNGEAIAASGDDMLWFTEGATVYFSYRALTEAGIISESQYLARRESLERRYLENPLLGSVPLAGAANRDLSDKDMVNLLYDGGFLAAEALDSRISELTSGGRGLIDVIRMIYKENPGGVAIDTAVLADAVTRCAGLDLTGFIERLVSVTDSRASSRAQVSS